ncbi:MAG: hypothetical protein AAGI91_05225 [Bacteroidota bacterium]
MIRLFFLVLLAASAAPAAAQFGIGGQVGDPTGLALRFGAGPSAFDLAAGWDLDDDRLFVQGHLLLRERRVPGAAADLRYFYGPGAFLSAADDRDTGVGFSFNAGLGFHTGPIEIFGQLTPRLALAPDTDFDLGGALGLRYYP